MAAARYRIVVVDDDLDIRALARRHLERSQRFAVVAEAADGQEAVAAARAQQPDVMLLDLHMPDGDGLVALPKIREAAPGSMVVVLSGLERARAERESLAAGAVGFLPKSPSWGQLATNLLDLLEGPAPDRGESTVELPAELSSGHHARRFVREKLAQWDAVDLLEDAQLLTTELVNNAVVHATSAVKLRLRLRAGSLRVEVADSGEGALHRQRVDLHNTGGRGLFLVEALSSSWGTSVDSRGKVVWFELNGGRQPDSQTPHN